MTDQQQQQQPRPPLWRLMDCAFRDEALSPNPEPMHQVFRDGYAAEIRAVADAIPEEFYGANGVRAWLLEEARKAEAGDQ